MVVNILLILFSILIIISVIRQSCSDKNTNLFFNIDVTNSLRGVAIIAIVLSHIMQAEPLLINSVVGGRFVYTIVFAWGGIGVATFFLLSGYGCFLSINKSQNCIKWLILHIAKMMIYFIICFVFVILIRIFVLGDISSPKEYIISFVTLKLPGTSSWYFKIQLLFYILLAISNKSKSPSMVVTSLVLMYATVVWLCDLPDYWWKTSMCFAAGCIIADNKKLFERYANKLWMIMVVTGAGIVSFIYIRKDFRYIFIPQLVSYVLIAICIAFVWNAVGGKNKVFGIIGKASLPMYLIHIGLVDITYMLKFSTNIKTIIFVVLIAVGTLITYLMSEKANKLLTKE